MATSHDVREVVSKLSSDKAKSRDEGVKLLSSWLEGERSIGFCRLLGRNTARLKLHDIPNAETWPFLLTLLTKCISLEISASKKRPPKLLYARTLRTAIQCAEDPKLSGKTFLLISIVKVLFNHIWDVMKDVPSFQSEYSSILRHLIAIKEYRYLVRKRVYCDLLVLFLNKAAMVTGTKSNVQSSSKEDLFRCILTLHVLLENPPGDFPVRIREDLVNGFSEIFSYVRDEGKISRKLMECVNTYLIKDGLNLGCQAAQINSSVQEFMFRCWPTTHDRGLKNAFILYARLQLKLGRCMSEGSVLVEQLLDVVAKELDQSTIACSGMVRSDTSKDEKVGGVTQHGLLELAAAVFYQACTNMKMAANQEKRLKREHAAGRVKDGLLKGSWLWNGAFCFLIHSYGKRIEHTLLTYWLEGACESLQRILNKSSILGSHDALLWLLRALQELCSLDVFPTMTEATECPCFNSNEAMLIQNNWNVIWTCLIQGLPIFSSAIPVVDVALELLGNMLLREQIGTAVVPQDMWDLRIFKHMPSPSALYFIACYFSKRALLGDLRDALNLRKNLLRAVMELINFKESTSLSEQIVMLIPAAAFSLSCGCAPVLPYFVGMSFFSEPNEDGDKLFLMERNEHGLSGEVLECSVDVLAEIQINAPIKVKTEHHCSLRLPRQISQPLFLEMEEDIIGFVTSCAVAEKMVLPDLINICSLLCYWIFSSLMARLREKNAVSVSKVFDYISQLLALVVSEIEEKYNEIQSRGCVGFGSIFDASGSTLSSVQSLVSCPLFSVWEDKCNDDSDLLGVIIESIRKLLVILAKMFSATSKCTNNLYCGSDTQGVAVSSVTSLQEDNSIGGCGAQIVDMDLDADDGSKDVDPLGGGGSNNSAASFSPLQWKLKLVSVISSFYSVLPLLTWETLFNMLENESDVKVSEIILHALCKCLPDSAGFFSSLVTSIKSIMERNANLNLCCSSILSVIHALLGTLLSISSSKKHGSANQCDSEMLSQESLTSLSELVSKVAETGLPDWFGRIGLIECICCFTLLEPRIAQPMIGRLLAMLQDTDYRVRFLLARRIGVLFQTWDGHDELFHDICSNFGFEMVRTSKEKLVKAPDVLSTCAWSVLTMETALITIAHLAFCSEEVEFEAVFMLCAAAAIDPCQRKLTFALIDYLSKRLGYASRIKYLEELMGSILARWVACEVSLVALVEVQDLFVAVSEPKLFMQCCCPWLLPPLILRRDMPNLNWVSKVACRPLSVIVKDYFVPIFALGIAVDCSGKPDMETGGVALHTSFLHIAEISELQRDDLIKKNMVSIVSFLLSLTSAAISPALPLFAKSTVVLSVRTVVDGFLEMDDHTTPVVIVDKINIFRPDRVFKFLVEIHYQITTAIHPWHKRNRLSALEALVDIIGHRTAVSSTSNYLFNIVGQHIGNQLLQDQCCAILSKLLEAFKSSARKEVLCILGEQLQFVVSKLVTSLIPSENSGKKADIPSSRIISFLHQLTVDADASLYDYIRELEPFPELDFLDKIRNFHEDLCEAYSTRDRFLMFVGRSCYLPQGLLLWSLRTLHKKLLKGEIVMREKNINHKFGEGNFWNCDPEVVTAVWTLVGLCRSNEANDMSELLADFISRAGIGDPYRVVFHLPKGLDQKHLSQPSCFDCSTQTSFSSHTVIPEECLISLLRLLKKYLLDDSVTTVDMTSRTLQGILSTERGQAALLSLNSYESSLIAVHSKGVNFEVVEKLLSDFAKRFRGDPLEDSSLWSTEAKTYETWVCSLVHSLISHCDDIILRLCQDIVLLKAEVAELLFASVLFNLASRIGLNIGLCQVISRKVQESIFCEANDLVKSTQVFLDAMNCLRSFYVIEKASAVSASVRQAKPSSYTKSRGTSERLKDHSSNALNMSSLWDKVYWLSVDYLVVAKAAIRCGSYFTAILYVEHWCEEHFNVLTLGCPDFSHMDMLPQHIELLVAAVTQINEPDSIYGIIQSHKLTSQLTKYEHEGNWSKAVECYDLHIRSAEMEQIDNFSRKSPTNHFGEGQKMRDWKCYKGLMRSLQKTGCTHVLDMYCHGLASHTGYCQHDPEFTELQYEAAWRAGNWDFSLLSYDEYTPNSRQYVRRSHFNENLHSCLRALEEGDMDDFHRKLTDTKKELVLSIADASRESTEVINCTIVKLQILDHLGMAWDLRWKSDLLQKQRSHLKLINENFPKPFVPTSVQMERLNADWGFILRHGQLHLNLLEPFIAFRRVLLRILECKECITEHLLQSASTLRKGSRFSLATAALHELKLLCCQMKQETLHTYILGRLEEAKILHAQGQHEMAVSLARYVLQNYQMGEEASNVYRLVGKWLAEMRSSNSRTILEQYMKQSVELTGLSKSKDENCVYRQCQTYFHLAHYTDGLFKSYEERLNSSEWQAAMRLRKHKTRELDALIKRLKCSTKGEKTDYSVKIQELQKQLTMDREEAEKLQDDRDSFLRLALEGYQHCLVIGGKYDLRVVFRLVSLWFNLCSRQNVVKAMHSTVKEVQSYKFLPLVYQIASRLGSSRDGQGSTSFQVALVSLLKKMAIDHPYHTIFQLLALSNGDRIKDKQRSRNSFVVDMDKKIAAENLLNELSSHRGAIIQQMKQMVEIYIKLAELETKREETNKKIPLPRDIRSIRQLELVPVVTATIPVDPTCQYKEGSFPHFKGLADSVMVMNGINAPKVVECFGSDGHKYRQLAKSGNDDLRQDAVMEQFFGLVNTFLQNHRDTWKRKLGIRTYKVVPFTPSAGVLEWVDRTIPLGEYLIGSTRSGGAHGRYGIGDWSFLQCREYMTSEKDKHNAFLKVCQNFRPVMHYFFLERFLQPADWLESRLSYSRSVAASSMVGYIVGLGDRHSMNILIDQDTAEVVHIDLGVAFEQGLMLKTPERVPFRLTRDIIDGMGVTGVEGVFRRCCEETLSVMRTNKEALLTIIEVFVHDPLYKWALSPLKALQRQKETDEDTDSTFESSQDAYEGNKDAARATLRVKQKLDGYEDGEMRSVQGQVQQLIQDAIDTDRLCQMFPGWGAWM